MYNNYVKHAHLYNVIFICRVSYYDCTHDRLRLQAWDSICYSLGAYDSDCLLGTHE